MTEPRLATQYRKSQQPPLPDFIYAGPARRYRPPDGYGLSAPFNTGGIPRRYIAPVERLPALDAEAAREADERAERRKKAALIYPEDN